MIRYMLLQNYEGGAGTSEPMANWAPGDIKAHIDRGPPGDGRARRRHVTG